MTPRRLAYTVFGVLALLLAASGVMTGQPEGLAFAGLILAVLVLFHFLLPPPRAGDGE